MKRLAIIGASYLQLPLIEKAKQLGYETHVFAWKANDVGELAADHFYPISIREKDRILDECKKTGVDGVCSIASDLAYITVNYIADSMGFLCNSMQSVDICTNKYLMREAFRKNGDPSPDHIRVCNYSEDIGEQIRYPAIVKPTDRSGSRGVCMLHNGKNLKSAIENALSESFGNEAIIEEYIEGEEYSVEYISYQGTHHYLAVTKKITTGEPHYIETGHVEPSGLGEDTIKEIKKVVEHALDTLGIRNGASHTEIKINDAGTIKIIETGARMGGDCIGSDLVLLSTGIDFVKAVIDVSVGRRPQLEKCRESISAEVVYMITEDDVKKWEDLKRSDPQSIIRNVYYEPEKLGRTTDSSNRIGCYIKRTQTIIA